jgi:hypothetical protein
MKQYKLKVNLKVSGSEKVKAGTIFIDDGNLPAFVKENLEHFDISGAPEAAPAATASPAGTSVAPVAPAKKPVKKPVKKPAESSTAPEAAGASADEGVKVSTKKAALRKRK